MKDYPFYISEINNDVAKMLTQKTLMFKEMEIGLFVISKSGEDVGRCAVIINKKFQAEKQTGAGFIGFFAAAEGCDQEVAEMIEQAENWLKERGAAGRQRPHFYPKRPFEKINAWDFTSQSVVETSKLFVYKQASLH